MTKSQALAFLRQAATALQQHPGEKLPDHYLQMMEGHFHTIDQNRNTVPLWPYEENIVPTRGIREQVGPIGYRYLLGGIAEHYWQIRLLCDLQPTGRILDIGCGYGKTAIALKRYLKPPGGFVGFDIQPRLTSFATRMFKALKIDSYFRAEHHPIIGNPYYKGTDSGTPADQFVFPYPEREFDAVCSFSVFTHLRTGPLQNYAKNLGRVVKPGGKMLLSFYLLDNAPEAGNGGEPWAASQRRNALLDGPDPAERGVLKVLNPRNPEYLVAYRVEYVRKAFAQFGFTLDRPPLFGSWAGRANYFGHQDYLVFRRD